METYSRYPKREVNHSLWADWICINIFLLKCRNVITVVYCHLVADLQLSPLPHPVRGSGVSILFEKIARLHCWDQSLLKSDPIPGYQGLISIHGGVLSQPWQDRGGIFKNYVFIAGRKNWDSCDVCLDKNVFLLNFLDNKSLCCIIIIFLVFTYLVLLNW